MAPEVFGSYTLLNRIAVGGMGEVFLARRRGPSSYTSHVVLKRVRSEFLDQANMVQMFLSEGRIAALLDHPNVVHTYELGDVDGVYFMAMEYVDGRDLGALVKALGAPLDLDVALHVMIGACDGLEYAHSIRDPEGAPLSLIHRDINPHNILISYSGAVKVADFGIAKAAGEDRLTQTGVVKGKYAYLSPEQALGGPLDRRADIYALGLLLFEITTGTRANPGSNEAEMLHWAIRGQRRIPSTLVPGYPPELERIYERATAVDREGRYGTARELQEDLLGFQLRHRIMVAPRRLAELMQRVFPPQPVEAPAAEEPARQVTSTEVLGVREPAWDAPATRPLSSPSLAAAAKRPSGTFSIDSGVNPPASGETAETVVAGPGRTGVELARTVPVSTGTETVEREQAAGSAGTVRLNRVERLEAAAIEVQLDARPPSGRRRQALLATVTLLASLAAAAFAVVVFWPEARPADPLPAATIPAADPTARVASRRDAPVATSLHDARPPLPSAPAADAGMVTDGGRVSPDVLPPRRVPGVKVAVGSPRSGSVPLQLSVSPRVAVFWRGKRLGLTPIRVQLPSGAQTLILRDPSLGINVSRRVVLRAGWPAALNFELGKGWLDVRVRPYGEVEVDGVRRGTTPMKPFQLYEGTHEVRLTKGRERYRVTVTIRPGQTAKVVHLFSDAM